MVRYSNLATYILATLAFGLMAYGYIWQFQGQTVYSDMIMPETVKALEIIRADPGPTITSAYSMSLWVSALTLQDSYPVWTSQPPAAFQADYEHVRCVLGWRACDLQEAVDALGVKWVLVDTRFPWLQEGMPEIHGAPQDVWRATMVAPWLTLEYQEGWIWLWQIQRQTPAPGRSTSI